MNIKKVLALVVLSLFTTATAQTYKNVRVKQDGLSIMVQYDMAGELFRGDGVALTYSLDNGKTYSVIHDAEGDLGANILPGKNNEINWLLIDKDFIIGKIIKFRMVTLPEGMIYVDGGEFTRTSNTDKKTEQSKHAVQLGSFLMDKTEVTQTMIEEIFGPVLTVYTYKDEDFEDILDLCDKASLYALTGSIFSSNEENIQKAYDKLRFTAGNFYINDKPTGAVVAQQPFGGARASGTNDKAGGPLNLLRWISPRTIKRNNLEIHNWKYPFMDKN